MQHATRHQIRIRLLHALTAKGNIETARAFAATFDATTPGPDETMALVDKACRTYDLDRAWILHGENGMDVAQETPVFAMQRVSPASGRWQLEEVERIMLGTSILGPGRFVTKMESRALEPNIRQGAYVVVDTEQDRVPADNATAAAFAVDIHGEGLVVRLARMRDADHLELFSADSHLPPVVVPLGDSDSRVVGRVVWVAQTL